MARIVFKSLILLALFMNCASCKNQSINSTASFPRGREQLDNYLKKNMQWRQSQLTIEGKVYVSYLVKENGDITDVIVTKGLCKSCDEEAIRLVKNMPNWLPAKKEGKSVKSINTLPIDFKLYKEK